MKGEGTSAFEKLRRLARPAPPMERCEMCSTALADRHQHLIEPATRKLICACDTCAILFGSQTKFKRIPQRVRRLDHFLLSDAQWDGLLMPINLAFFFHSTPHGRVAAMYPSPAGPTESLLPLDAWTGIVRDNPVLEQMEADVEALLVNRIGHARGFTNPEYYLTPIDECYKLVGLIRGRWHGLSGGAEVWQEIAGFFEELKRRSPRQAGAMPDVSAASVELNARSHA